MKEILESKMNRRALLRNTASAGAGLAFAGLLAGCGGSDDNNIDVPGGGGGLTDAQILNFALNLEYLEAEYYLLGAFGRSLSSGDTGGGPAPVGGRRVNDLSGIYKDIAEELANDEETHVKLLRGSLAGAAVPRPLINFTDTFTALARGAGVVGPNDTFDPFASQQAFILGAFVFEDVGVTAYYGAAPLIRDRGTLLVAAGIHAIEAYHAGAIRALILNGEAGDNGIDAANKISAFRGSVGGGKDEGVTVNGKANIAVSTSDQAIPFARTPAEITNIVTANGDNDRGGFFPNGILLSR